jgi:hypothetical protein
VADDRTVRSFGRDDVLFVVALCRDAGRDSSSA